MMRMNRRGLLAGSAACVAGLALPGVSQGAQTTAYGFTMPDRTLIDGIVWQPQLSQLELWGEWERLGASTLMVQWVVADGMAYMPGLGLPTVEDPPNWARILKEPWAQKIILGLATRLQEPVARLDVVGLVELSARIARQPMPFRPAAYYFPVEVDPSWQEATAMGPLLADLPRPLWISAYDNSNVGPRPFAEWVAGWLPQDVGLMFQDGVGLHMRTPQAARSYGEALRARLGAERFTLIAEAFRPGPDETLRSASLEELGPQLQAYQGFAVLVFDGPTYLNRKLIYGLERDYMQASAPQKSEQAGG
ncbi:hypothetical protein ACT6QH_07610 [Xanthobacter sp. TB0139]|uniref:hypothetical protein n=1 Tax=Xanthobacter sp. TB0139 TaxID=3459178 RepID=UPI0040393385